MRPSSDHVLLVGMMGAGKTTVGRLVAELLGRPYVDSDVEVEQATGMSVPEMFAVSGEPAFRAAESKALADAAHRAIPSVISVAGGAVLDPANRRLLASAGSVVWLRATPETLVARLGRGEGRVLLRPDPATAVPRLIAERYPLYAELASATVDVDGLEPRAAADTLLAALVRRVPVEVPGRPYETLVGPGALRRLGALLPDRVRRAGVVSQEGIGVEVDLGVDVVRVTIPDGEGAKSLRTIEDLCRAFARAGITRHDVVVAVGGGVVTDVAGFAASCYHRGLDLVNVPTTLLAQVDAAIGGKTGVNLPEGKNLVGAFWQPLGVVCDTATLSTLPEREWRSGLGEMAKYAFLGVDDLDRLPLPEQVARCVACKASVVADDERESGRRMILNYGHTLGHAVEAASLARPGGGLRHGEAVGIGLVFAARLARLLGRIDDARVERHVEVVAGYGLPTEIPAGADPAELLAWMARDKKATEGLTFVLDGPSGVEPVRGVERRVVEQALVGLLAGEQAGTAPRDAGETGA